MNTRTFLIAAITLVSHSALADSKEKLGEEVLDFAAAVADTHHGKPAGSVEDCRSLVASLEQAGVADGDRLYGSFYTDYDYEYVHVDPEKNNQHYTTLGEAKKICDDLASMKPAFGPLPQLVDFQTQLETLGELSIDDMVGGEGDAAIDAGQKCAQSIDDALAAGASADQPLELRASTMGSDPLVMTLGDAKTKICQALTDWGNKWTGQLKEMAAKRQADLEAPYRAVGIGGDRLALFVSFGKPEDAGFYLPGCDRFAEDAKTMKKAKKLFLWFGDEYGPVTIHKFVFKGDHYTESERTFDFRESAYRWCK